MPITVHSLKVLGLAGPIPTGMVTVVRLYERNRRETLGYDDAFAALSLGGLILFTIGIFLHVGNPAHLSQTSRIAFYYIIAQGFYATIWPARLSILAMVIRLTFPHSKMRRFLYVVGATFALIWAILAAQVFWVCEKKPKWREVPHPQCPLGKDVAIAQLISDIYADSILIIAPLRLLWNLELSWKERTRLLLVFSSSIITSVSSLIHAYYILRVGGMSLLFVAIIEACSSLLVCNLPVIVSLMVRLGNAIKSRMGGSQECETFSLGGKFRGFRGGLGSENSSFGRKTGGTIRFAHTVDTVIRVDLETVTDHDRSVNFKEGGNP